MLNISRGGGGRLDVYPDEGLFEGDGSTNMGPIPINVLNLASKVYHITIYHNLGMCNLYWIYNLSVHDGVIAKPFGTDMALYTRMSLLGLGLRRRLYNDPPPPPA